jgi:uncharacterized protein
MPLTGHENSEAEDIRTRMRRGLTAAMKARDQRAVTALRSALAAIDNAEAVDAAQAVDTATAPPAVEGRPASGGSRQGGPASGRPPPGGARPAASMDAPPGDRGPIAGAVVGLGAAEVQRRTLTPAETQAIVRGEVAERRTAARAYERAGQAAPAERLRAEAEVLSAYLDDVLDNLDVELDGPEA